MIDHDYVLQALLYTAALDRHLSVCVPDYDYDRDFGGAYYLFLRGLSPTHFDGCGVFHDRAPKGLVEALLNLGHCYATYIGVERDPGEATLLEGETGLVAEKLENLELAGDSGRRRRRPQRQWA